MATFHDTWLPLVDYAFKKGISLSTLRRYIKQNKIQYKLENGKYLICDHTPMQPTAQPEASASFDEIHKLETELKKYREEIAELKTLIALYEEKSDRRVEI